MYIQKIHETVAWKVCTIAQGELTEEGIEKESLLFLFDAWSEAFLSYKRVTVAKKIVITTWKIQFKIRAQLTNNRNEDQGRVQLTTFWVSSILNLECYR